jgi:hypothetical protein
MVPKLMVIWPVWEGELMEPVGAVATTTRKLSSVLKGGIPLSATCTTNTLVLGEGAAEAAGR